MLTACKITDINENGNDSSDNIIQALSEGADTLKPDSGGQHDFCPIHDINFHAISTSWLEYLGQDVYDEWLENKFLVAKQNPDYLDMPCGGIGITDLIHDFNISKETFYEVGRPPLTQETIDFYAERGEKITDDIFYNRYSYIDEQIDAFYSNDPIRIANAICGDLGFVN